MAVHWIDRFLHTCTYFVGLCLDESSYQAELNRLKVPAAERPPFLKNEHSAATVDFFFNQGTQQYSALVRLRNQPDKLLIQVYALLVHEAVHIWQRHCDNIGEENPSPEFEAYAVQRLSQNLMEAYDEAQLLL